MLYRLDTPMENPLMTKMTFTDYVTSCVRGMKNCDKWVVNPKWRFMITLNPKVILPDGIDDYNNQLQTLKKIFISISGGTTPAALRFFVEYGDYNRLHWHIQVDLGTKRNSYTFWRVTIPKLVKEYYYKISSYHCYLDEYLNKEILPEWIHNNPIQGYESLDEARVIFEPELWERGVVNEVFGGSQAEPSHKGTVDEK